MFYVNDKLEGKVLYTETIKLYCIVLYCIVAYCIVSEVAYMADPLLVTYGILLIVFLVIRFGLYTVPVRSWIILDPYVPLI